MCLVFIVSRLGALLGCCQPLSFLFIHSHQTAPTHFFGIPLLDQPLVVRVLAATSAILAFIVGHPLFVGLDVGFGRNLPHSWVCQQLEAFFDRNNVRHSPTLHPTSTWWSSSRGALAFASRSHRVSTLATQFWDDGREALVFIFFVHEELRPRPRARPRPQVETIRPPCPSCC